MDEPISIAEQYPARYWHKLPDGRIRCDLCPRVWHQIRKYAVTENGTCPQCGTPPAGHFGKFAGQFGRQRIPFVVR
jgi:hypothetical protein